MSTSIVEAAFLKAVKENLCNNTRDARLAFEIAWESRGAEIEQIAFNALQVMEFDEQQLSEAQAQIAMQAEALNAVFNATPPGTHYCSPDMQLVKEALTLTSETVAAWGAKETEPYKREVAMLHGAVIDISHTDWPTEDVLNKLEKAISDTQATALTYEREVENRGAVKALGKAALRLRSEQMNRSAEIVEFLEAELRAANKGEVK